MFDNDLYKRPSPTALLNPLCDPIFKAIFTQATEDSELALKSFLSAILGRNIVEVELQPNEPAVDAPSQMQMSFDVAAKFDDGEYADIEVQRRRENYEFAVRSEIQVARLLNSNVKKGSNWHVEKVYQISVLNFEFDKDDKSALSWYTMKNSRGKGLGDRLNVIYLDLVKIHALFGKPVEDLELYEKWGLYLSYADDESRRDYINRIVESEKGIMAAEHTVKFMSEEEANWFRQNSYDTAMRDYNSRMEYATKTGLQRGLEQGLQQGLQQKAIEDTINLLKLKVLSVEQIAQVVNLPIEKVQELEQSL